ncbi:YybH family protein [Actinoplanes awajinensis]|uniref:SnoaL-like domain-containing protein n=1 Tax=Actinoplanes awajinensis subsp. mycoplanecinus TaxID=135947 RepID=A0A0X3UTM6_9ACTN|nr:nuclear transport factor 2 family protein [Actinoplanes awajinensis]KUL34226.1 hypothetical protein ADL15_16450 [Actinoplanes awajinensis subsp. mycoplanecinus]
MEEIRKVIEARAALLEKGDVDAIVAYYAPQVVQFTLAPPLRQPAGMDPAGLAAWIAGFEAPPRREVTQLEITTDGDVAFATSIDSMAATPRGASEGFRMWYRVTTGLRRIDGRWLITHEHQSVPFEMDGSLRASVDLEP